MNNKLPHNKIFWSDNELFFLKENYLKLSNTELGLKLNKTSKNIGRKLKELNLFKTIESRKEIKTRRNKEVGTDLSFEYVSNIAKKYNSRGEFYQFDRVAYNKAVKEKWLDKISTHMVSKNYSIPQLLLKDLLEFILGEKCSYNDRKAIKPLEIDCYFEKWKIGWEYDGKFFHNTEKDKIKKDKCLFHNITLFNIDELNESFRNYEVNIKNQIIRDLPLINKITNLNITEEKILNYKINLVYPNVLTFNEKKIVEGKTMNQIKEINIDLFKKIKKYKLYTENSLKIINDLKTYNKFKNISEYINYLKLNYMSFNEVCKREHPHRIVKKLGTNIEEIRKIFN